MKATNKFIILEPIPRNNAENKAFSHSSLSALIYHCATMINYYYVNNMVFLTSFEDSKYLQIPTQYKNKAEEFTYITFKQLTTNNLFNQDLRKITINIDNIIYEEKLKYSILESAFESAFICDLKKRLVGNYKDNMFDENKVLNHVLSELQNNFYPYNSEDGAFCFKILTLANIDYYGLVLNYP